MSEPEDFIFPVGPYLYAIDEPVVVEEEERAKRAGIAIVINEKNIPRPTSAKVVALGDDEDLRALIKVGDVVFFSKYCTDYHHVNGVAYHLLALSDIKGVKRKRVCPASPQDSSTSEHVIGDQTSKPSS